MLAESSFYNERRLATFHKSGYDLARMPYDIVLAPEAVEDLRSLKANLRAEVEDAIELYLRHEPKKLSRSRIKRLRGLSRPQYRLRVGDEIRVFYDINANTVEVLAIIVKSEADAWLERSGERDEEGGPV
jgi:mRNA-degrading endonuclease RelE of RelBE toxin-antitoxin system